MMMVARVERVEPVRVAGLMRAKRGEGGHKTRGAFEHTTIARFPNFTAELAILHGLQRQRLLRFW